MKYDILYKTGRAISSYSHFCEFEKILKQSNFKNVDIFMTSFSWLYNPVKIQVNINMVCISLSYMISVRGL